MGGQHAEANDMRPYAVNMTYEPFAREPEYIEANRAFIARMELGAVDGLLDLACGIGTMSDLLFERAPGLPIVGIDLSRESLAIAAEQFRTVPAAGAGRRRPLGFVQATADVLPCGDGSFDAVVMGNAIHMLPDADRLVAEIGRVLRPGGFLAFNSSFYAGTMPRGTERFHHEWMKLAVGYLVRKDLESRRAGGAGIPRRRGTMPGAFSHQWPSPEEWRDRLRRHGFSVTLLDARTVTMTQRNFECIGAYGGFAKVVLSGYPVAEASEALQATAGPALAAVGMTTVPRLWLEMIARKEKAA